MAVLDTGQLQRVIVDCEIAEEGKAAVFAAELEQQVSQALNGYVTHDRLELTERRLLQAMGELQANVTAALAEFRAEMREANAALKLEIAELRGEMRGEIATLRGEMRGEIGRLERLMGEMEARMTSRTLQGVGITLGGIALAVGILLGFG